MVEDFERCYRAVQARDARFDGWFFVGVTTTGIFCRPSCPARTPGRERVRFYPSAAAAQRSGFRACLRCRPDAVAGSPEWNLRADVVGRALRLVADGVVDREGVAGLAHRLHYGVRHLHRLLLAEVGAGPLALARAQRAQTARVLIETTALPMADVAFAAGFSSIRQFNDTVRQALGRTPTELRRAAQRRGARRVDARREDPALAGATTVSLRLAHRRPIAIEDALAFLGARAVPGLERYDGNAYARTLRLPHGHGTVELEASPPSGGARAHVGARLRLQDLRDLGTAVERCRRLLDLDADPEAVDASLSEDAALGRLVARVPGRRIPGTTDGFELAVRAIAGQQVSVSGARTVVGRLVSAAGPDLDIPAPEGDTGLSKVFPSPLEVLEASAAAFAMPGARRAAVRGVARLLADETLVIDPGADPLAVRAGLLALPGVGPWTADYVAMRALGDPDVFLASDLGAVRGLQALGLPSDRRGALATSERWRPWRSYALLHLWGSDARTATPRERAPEPARRERPDPQPNRRTPHNKNAKEVAA